LPVELTSFVGRERLLSDVIGALTREASPCRLLTLTGTGGTGKTRVAVEAARAAGNRFPDGVVFVALTAISDPALVIPTIAQTLGLPDTGRPALESLIVHLRNRCSLLVLDNFEHVLRAGNDIARLLMDCLELKVIVTSRAPLRISGEFELVVPPMVLPDRAIDDPSVLLASESICLFVERARAIRAGFDLTVQNAQWVAEICRQLDGLPLAIELATARLRLLDLQTLLARLDQRLELLSSVSRDLPARQQTLRSTIAWSYDLLDAPEQATFARLAVFVGGCSLEAAEAMCQTGGKALDLIEGLVANSLLQPMETTNARVRITMLETVREFGLERLARTGELELTRRRHAEYFLSAAERAEAQLPAPGGLDWLDPLELEHDNFRAALEYCLEMDGTDGHEIGLRLAGALVKFWWLRGHIDEGRRWLSRALRDGRRSASRMKALHGAGWLAVLQSDLTSARRFLEESLDIARDLDDQPTIAWALLLLGLVAAYNKEADAGRRLGDESLVLAEALGDQALVAWALQTLVVAARGVRDFSTAQTFAERSLAIRRELGDEVGVAAILLLMAGAALEQGEFPRARSLYGECLPTFARVGSRWWLSHVLAGFANLAARQQQPLRAARLIGATMIGVETSKTRPIPLTNAALLSALDLAQHVLGEGQFAAALAEGRAMTTDEAVAEARAVEVEGPRRRAPERHAAGLTGPELNVLRLLAAGRSSKQIAAELTLGVSTVDRHITHIYDKIGDRGRAAATAFALRHGLL
jgi:predicted ATPase/DNA-binding CsgD family transcriptional regulator